MAESRKPLIAVIGLGSMGFGMAISLRRAGFEVTGCDVSTEAVARFVADGGKGAKTPAEAAKNADIVVTMGCGDECPYIPGRRYIDWDLKDPKGLPIGEVREIRDDIAKRLEGLLAEISAGV